MERQKIYKRIDAAKAAIKPTHPDAATDRTVVTDKAATQYLNTVRNILGVDPATGNIRIPTNPQLIIKAVQDRANKLSTLRKYARSIRHYAIKRLSVLLKKAQDAQRDGNWSEVERLVSLDIFDTYTVLTQMLPADYRVGWEPKRKRHGKKTSIADLPKNWRELLANQVHGQFRIPAIVVLLTGCRPAEVEKGVLIERIDGALYATIKSAKHTDKAGQEQRRFRLADHPVTNILMNAMDESEVTRNKMLVRVSHGNSLTTHLREAARKLWPWRKESITAYSARHAMAADCKKAIQNGADPDLASKVLGHIVDKTASYYGSTLQSGGVTVAPTDVVVPQKIKHKVRDRNNLIKQGLLKKDAKIGSRKK